MIDLTVTTTSGTTLDKEGWALARLAKLGEGETVQISPPLFHLSLALPLTLSNAVSSSNLRPWLSVWALSLLLLLLLL
jgi:hypothetical protein